MSLFILIFVVIVWLWVFWPEENRRDIGKGRVVIDKIDELLKRLSRK